MRTLIRPTAFVDSPFDHDGKAARLAGGLNWFVAVELIAIEGQRRTSTELIPVELALASFQFQDNSDEGASHV